MTVFGAKVKLTVDTSTKVEFNKQIQEMVQRQVTIDKIKVNKIDCTAAVKEVRNQLESMLSALSVSNGVNITGLKEFIGTEGLDATRQKINETADAAVEKLNKARLTTSEWEGQLKGLNTTIASVTATYKQGMKAGIDTADDIATRYRNLIADAEQFQTVQQTSTGKTIQKVQEEAVALQQRINNLKQEATARNQVAAATQKAAAAAETLASTQQRAVLYTQVTNFLNSNSRMDLQNAHVLKQYAAELSTDGDVALERLNKIKTSLADIRIQTIASGKTGRSFASVLQNAYERFGGWMLVTHSLMLAMQQVRNMVTNVTELDAAMTELRKVTDETDETYATFFTEATARAKEFGATVADTITATADFARLGYSLADASELANAALVYKNVGDGIESISDASDSIISTMKAFNIEASQAMFIVDKYNEVGNNYAISSKGVGDALLRSAAALASANNSLDESIALATATNSVVQDPDKVGTALKTVSMYLRAAKTEAEEAGESTDGMAASVSKLRDELLSLTGGKVDIQLDEDTFKSTYQIMKELSSIWNELTDITQANILEKIGGKRNANVVASLLNNFSIAEEVLQTAANASGSALAENEKYLDSINGKIALFQASFETFSADFISSDLIKNIVDSGTVAINILDSLTNCVGALPLLITAASTAWTALNNAKGNHIGYWDIDEKSFEEGFVKITTANNALTTFRNNFNTAKELGSSNAEALKVSLSSLWNGVSQTLATYNENLGKSSEDQVKFINNVEKGNPNLAKYLKTLDGGAATFSGYKTYCEEAGVKVEGLGVQAQAAAIKVTLLNTAFRLLGGLAIGFVVTFAISKIISGISSLINAQEEERQKIIENGEEATDHATKLQELADSYFELSEAVKNGNGSRTDLIAAQKELLSYLGLESSAIAELAGQYGSLDEAINKVVGDSLQKDIADMAASAQELQDAAISKLAERSSSGSGSNVNAIGDGAAEAVQYLQSKGFDEVYTKGDRSTIILPNLTHGKDVTFGQLKENYDYLQSVYTTLSEQYDSSNPMLKQINKRLTAYSEYMDDAIEQIDSTNENITKKIIASNKTQALTSEEYKNLVEETAKSIESDPNFNADGSYSALELANKHLASENDEYAKFSSQLQEAEYNAKAIQKRIQNIAEWLSPADYKNAEYGTASYSRGVEIFEENVDALKEKLSELSDEEINALFEVVDSGEIKTWSEALDFLDKYNQGMSASIRHSEDLKSSISSMWYSDDFSDTKDELVALAESADGISPEKIIELSEDSETLASILAEDGMNAEYLANILQSLSDGNGLDLITPELLALNEALDGMSDRFDSIVTAKSRYDAAMSVDEKDVDFQSYASAFEELNKQFEAGTTNSNAFWAAAEFLFGKEQLETWNYGVDEIYQASKNLTKVFSDADSAGSGFIKRLYEMYQAGKLINENGEELLSISKDSQGAYSFNIDPDNIAAIAKKMGMTEDAALACFKALSMWGDIDFYDIDEVIQTIDDLGISAEFAGKKVIDLDALKESLTTLGKNGKEINDIVNNLSSLGNIQFVSTQGSLDDILSSLTDIGIASKDEDIISIDTESLGTLLVNIGLTRDEAKDLVEMLSEADNIKFSDVQGAANAMEYISALDFANIEEDVESIDEAVDDLNEETTENVTAEIEAVGTAAQIASGKLSHMRDEILSIDGMKAKVSINVSGNYDDVVPIIKKTSSTTTTSIPSHADGIKSSPEEIALTGEEAPELILSGNRAYLSGTNGPEIVKLKRGDRVYNGDDTKKILQNYGSRIFGSIPAYKDGTISGNLSTTKLSIGKKYTVSTKTTVDSSSLEDALKDTLENLKDELDKIITAFEHTIYLLGKTNGSTTDIVAIYRKMQESVHAQAEKYRAMGLAENSEYIQALQKQWWEYQDSIQSAIVADYDKSVSERENAITLTENWLENAISKHQLDKVKSYSEAIVSYYKKMQDIIHEQADYYRSQGYSDTSDEVSKLSDLWWEYADNITDVKQRVVDNLVDMVSETSDAVDNIQNVFDTLKSVADEYAANDGFISVDAFQKIVDLGPQYMQYLRDENGLLTINEDNINKVIAAKTEQLALDNALAYVERLRLALESDSIEDLNQLLYATTDATDATWGLVYSNLALLKLDDKQYQAALHNINAIRSLAETAISGIGKATGTLSDTLDEMKSGIDDILSYVMDMLEQRIEDQIDSLEDMKDTYADIISLKKESLKTSKEEADYQDEVASKIKEIAKLQARINALSLDDSRSAQAQRAELEEELAELQKDLADTQADYALDAQEDALDKMQDAYEDEKDKEIKILEDSISSYQKKYDMAIDYISNNWDSLYGELIDWNTEYGSVLNDEITTAWDNCLAAAQRYGNYVSALNNIDYDITQASGSDNSNNTIVSVDSYSSSTSNSDSITSIVNKMKANSKAWNSATAQQKASLDAENKQLGASLAQYGIIAKRDDETGVWYVNKIGGEKLYDKYHTGGIVGNQPSLKQNEVMAVLEKGEAVLDEQKEKGLYKAIDIVSYLSEKLGVDINKAAANSLSNSALMFNVSSSSQNALKDSLDKSLAYINNNNSGCTIEHLEVNAPVSVTQKLDENDIKQHADLIGNISAQRIKESFTKRGIKVSPSLI